MNQTIAHVQGYTARMEGAARNPPANLRHDFASAWLQGWDQCDKQIEEEKKAKDQ